MANTPCPKDSFIYRASVWVLWALPAAYNIPQFTSKWCGGFHVYVHRQNDNNMQKGNGLEMIMEIPTSAQLGPFYFCCDSNRVD